MSINAPEVEKGKEKRYKCPSEARWAKLMLHRRERRKIRQDINYEPQYKRYDGWLF